MGELPIIATAAMFLFGGATLLVLTVADLLREYEDAEAGHCQPQWPDDIDPDPIHPTNESDQS